MTITALGAAEPSDPDDAIVLEPASDGLHQIVPEDVVDKGDLWPSMSRRSLDRPKVTKTSSVTRPVTSAAPRTRTESGQAVRTLAGGSIATGGLVALAAAGAPWWVVALAVAGGVALAALQTIFPQESVDRLEWWRHRRQFAQRKRSAKPHRAGHAQERQAD